jgi:hypothetical protein
MQSTSSQFSNGVKRQGHAKGPGQYNNHLHNTTLPILTTGRHVFVMTAHQLAYRPLTHVVGRYFIFFRYPVRNLKWFSHCLSVVLFTFYIRIFIEGHKNKYFIVPACPSRSYSPQRLNRWHHKYVPIYLPIHQSISHSLRLAWKFIVYLSMSNVDGREHVCLPLFKISTS